MNPEPINKVKVAAFSLSASSPDGDDGPYLEWHQLDHMPEQYQIPGLLFAHRWASTPECRAARAVQSERFEPTNHFVHYLFGEPVAQAVDDWFTLGAHLHPVGRFSPPAGMLASTSDRPAARRRALRDRRSCRTHRAGGIYLAASNVLTTAARRAAQAPEQSINCSPSTASPACGRRCGTLRPERFDQNGYSSTVLPRRRPRRGSCTCCRRSPTGGRRRCHPRARRCAVHDDAPVEWDRFRHPG
jgi:hypothetical protein